MIEAMIVAAVVGGLLALLRSMRHAHAWEDVGEPVMGYQFSKCSECGEVTSRVIDG